MFELIFGKWSQGIMNAENVIELKITMQNNFPRQETFICKLYISCPIPHLQN